MVCPASTATTTPQDLGSYIEVASDSTSSLVERSEDKKGLQSRIIVILSNITRNVAVIETTRFLAIIGLVCSAVASVLLPALGFAAVAAGACVLKNRVIQLDERALQVLNTTVEEIADRTLSGPSPVRLQTGEPSSDGLIERPKRGSTLGRRMKPISEEVPYRTEVTLGIKESFLGSLEEQGKLNIKQIGGLLGVCYRYLLSKRIKEMPGHLKTSKNFTLDPRTERYLKQKCKDYPTQVDLGDISSAKEDLVNQKQKLLEDTDPSKCRPSEVMEIIRDLHTQMSKEKERFSEHIGAESHRIKAEHAEAYITQLREFESQGGLPIK